MGRRGDTGAVVVRIDPRYFRPAEVETLLGDPSKAREKLGWTPTTTLEELVAEMVDADVEEAKKSHISSSMVSRSWGQGNDFNYPKRCFAIFELGEWQGALSAALWILLDTNNYLNLVAKNSIYLICRRFSNGLVITKPDGSAPRQR